MTTNITPTSATPTPTFSAYRSDKRLQAHISRAFLKEYELTIQEAASHIILPDGSKWAVWIEDKATMDELIAFTTCYCIISFQLWKDGSTWAVARKHVVAPTERNQS